MRRLRGHHLFCGTLFQGCGYDEAFTRQMTETLAALAQGESILLYEGSDELCGACPHRLPGNKCALGTEDVLRRDKAALAAVNFQAGDTITPAGVGERLRQVTQTQWDQVCGGCRWHKEGLCSWERFQLLRQKRFV